MTFSGDCPDVGAHKSYDAMCGRQKCIWINQHMIYTNLLLTWTFLGAGSMVLGLNEIGLKVQYND